MAGIPQMFKKRLTDCMPHPTGARFRCCRLRTGFYQQIGREAALFIDFIGSFASRTGIGMERHLIHSENPLSLKADMAWRMRGLGAPREGLGLQSKPYFFFLSHPPRFLTLIRSGTNGVLPLARPLFMPISSLPLAPGFRRIAGTAHLVPSIPHGCPAVRCGHCPPPGSGRHAGWWPAGGRL